MMYALSIEDYSDKVLKRYYYYLYHSHDEFFAFPLRDFGSVFLYEVNL